MATDAQHAVEWQVRTTGKAALLAAFAHTVFFVLSFVTRSLEASLGSNGLLESLQTIAAPHDSQSQCPDGLNHAHWIVFTAFIAIYTDIMSTGFLHVGMPKRLLLGLISFKAVVNFLVFGIPMIFYSVTSTPPMGPVGAHLLLFFQAWIQHFVWRVLRFAAGNQTKRKRTGLRRHIQAALKHTAVTLVLILMAMGIETYIFVARNLSGVGQTLLIGVLYPLFQIGTRTIIRLITIKTLHVATKMTSEKKKMILVEALGKAELLTMLSFCFPGFAALFSITDMASFVLSVILQLLTEDFGAFLFTYFFMDKGAMMIHKAGGTLLVGDPEHVKVHPSALEESNNSRTPQAQASQVSSKEVEKPPKETEAKPCTPDMSSNRSSQSANESRMTPEDRSAFLGLAFSWLVSHEVMGEKIAIFSGWFLMAHLNSFHVTIPQVTMLAITVGLEILSDALKTRMYQGKGVSVHSVLPVRNLVVIICCVAVQCGSAAWVLLGLVLRC